jgi:hypothetical protein
MRYNNACRYLTNVRVVWKADLAANFNASIPYTTIQTIKVRNQTKFGRALVFGTFKRCQGYVLGNSTAHNALCFRQT